MYKALCLLPLPGDHSKVELFKRVLLKPKEEHTINDFLDLV